MMDGWMDDKQVDREKDDKGPNMTGWQRETYHTSPEVYLSTYPTIHMLRFTLETLYD